MSFQFENTSNFIEQAWNCPVPKYMRYHGIKQTERLIGNVEKIGREEGLSEEEIQNMRLVALFYSSGWCKTKDFQKFPEQSIQIATDYLRKKGAGESSIAFVQKTILDTDDPSSKGGKILVDAIFSDFVGKKGGKRLLSLYAEDKATGRVSNTSKKNWLKQKIKELKQLQFNTHYGQTILKRKQQDALLSLQKLKRTNKKRRDIALQMELGMDELELKQLLKKLRSATGRDDRGIQTLFRTTSKNHYTLGEMIDRKSNIIISISAIALSIVISGIISINNADISSVHLLPLLTLVLSCIPTIGFAILAIRPITKHSPRDKKTRFKNLLYFGDFTELTFEEYRKEMYKAIQKGTKLYDHMIYDLYHFGLKLKEKYKWFRLALIWFVTGFLISLIWLIGIRIIYGPAGFNF